MPNGDGESDARLNRRMPGVQVRERSELAPPGVLVEPVRKVDVRLPGKGNSNSCGAWEFEFPFPGSLRRQVALYS